MGCMWPCFVQRRPYLVNMGAWKVTMGMLLVFAMVWYGMVWYGMVWYGMVWYGMVWHGMVASKPTLNQLLTNRTTSLTFWNGTRPC
jgi:hypothetical protein